MTTFIFISEPDGKTLTDSAHAASKGGELQTF